MRNFKEFNVTLPETYLRELDELSEYYSNVKVGEIEEASVHMKEFNLEEKAVAMKDGYENMANINLSFAEMALTSDNDALCSYESLLKSGSDESEY